MRVYRTPRWKLIRDFKNPGRDEMFDLLGDTLETHNLLDSPLGAESERAYQRLSRAIIQNMEQIADPVLELARLQ